MYIISRPSTIVVVVTFEVTKSIWWQIIQITDGQTDSDGQLTIVIPRSKASIKFTCINYIASIATTLQISNQLTSPRRLMRWVPTRQSPCRYWLSTVGSWCRGRSPPVRCRSQRTGYCIVRGLDHRQKTTTTGSDLKRSTVCCSLATSDSELR